MKNYDRSVPGRCLADISRPDADQKNYGQARPGTTLGLRRR